MDTQNKYSFFASVARSHFEYNSLWKCIINERKNKPHSHFVIKNSWIPSPCKKSRIVLVSIRLRLKNINSICVWFIRKVLNPLNPCSCFSKWNKSALCSPRAGRHWREVGIRSGTRYYECQTPPWLAFLNASILHASKETLVLKRQ